MVVITHMISWIKIMKEMLGRMIRNILLKPVQPSRAADSIISEETPCMADRYRRTVRPPPRTPGKIIQNLTRPGSLSQAWGCPPKNLMI